MSVPKSNLTVDWATYESLSLDAPKSIVWASAGQDGSGKSAFALGAPEPIWVAAFDTHGMNRVGRQFKTREDGTPKDIRIKRYSFDPRPYKTQKEIADHAGNVWDSFIVDYRVAALNARTILIDREDLSYMILRYAILGALKAAAKEYEAINTEMTSLVQEAFAAGINLGLLRGVKDEWESQYDPAKGKKVGVSTGRKIPSGWKEAPDMVDITLFHYWDTAAKSFMTRIDKFTEKEWKGQEVPDLSFAQMAQLAYPTTEESEWI